MTNTRGRLQQHDAPDQAHAGICSLPIRIVPKELHTNAIDGEGKLSSLVIRLVYLQSTIYTVHHAKENHQKQYHNSYEGHVSAWISSSI